MLHFLYYEGLRLLGLPAVARRARQAGVILGFHNVVPLSLAPAGDPGVHLSLEAFTDQVSWLARHYRVIPLGEIVDRLAAGRSLRGLAAITFDDGYAGTLHYAWPLLLQLGLPATCFLVAGQPGAAPFWWDHPTAALADSDDREHWLTIHRGDGPAIHATLPAPTPPIPSSHLSARWEAVSLASTTGLTLGVHSYTHRNLTRLDSHELEHELLSSRDAIRQRTGISPEFFAYPYGRWDRRIRDAVQQAGYRAAVTLDYGLVTPGADPWALPRVNVPASIRPSAFEAWAAGLAPTLRRRSA